ncbi:hypothetical protein Cgig2_025631 [Carnegiea gigantea]|uniref:Glycosyltransferase n=1 Tax=Carnegiea gigantea TaxID=171969 RepID=A0A9Q1JV88_9CARY|nr:hypothetical protein Cgig2_025631 [Carnegiea gigantea]
MVIPSIAHISLLASPGLGHLIPMVELAKRLMAQHGLTVTVFAVTTEANRAEDELLQAPALAWPGLFSAVVLPKVVEVSAQLEANAAILTRLLAMVSAALPNLRSSIASMKIKPAALIVDLFATEAIKIAEEFNMKKYVFVASNARFLAYTLYFPTVEKEVKRDEPFRIPGCEPIPGEDLLELTFSPSGRAHQDFIRISRDITAVDGILVNTWEEPEHKTLGSLRDNRFMKPMAKVPVYSVGPVVRMAGTVGSTKTKTELTEWLDGQEDNSVVYVSFGSGGTISTEQTMEIAWGLELSKQKFVWVVRPPMENDTAASLFNRVHEHGTNEFAKYLPDGFLERTHKVGIVVPMWAPQEEILSHRSIGGFVTHCGWNSTLESIVNGVPMIAWPLYAEQNMNATMLALELNVAIRPETKPTKRLVKREEIAKMLRRLMVDEEGAGIRTRAKELKESANKALNEGGSSFIALSKASDTNCFCCLFQPTIRASSMKGTKTSLHLERYKFTQLVSSGVRKVKSVNVR